VEIFRIPNSFIKFVDLRTYCFSSCMDHLSKFDQYLAIFNFSVVISMIGVLGLNWWWGLGIFLFTTMSRTALGPAQPPIEWVPGALSLG
jgi:hypothetical protein